jgi:hypothetical protein
MAIYPPILYFSKYNMQSSYLLNEPLSWLLYNTWDKSGGDTKTAMALLLQFGITPHPRTLASWKAQWKRATRRNLPIDQSVEWERFDLFNEHGIPPHLYKQLHATSEQIRMQADLGSRPVNPPSYRTLRWWSYMLEYYDDTIPEWNDKEAIAGLLEQRERIAENTGRRRDFEDIITWLNWKPWLNESQANQYISLVNNEAIPKLQTHGWGSYIIMTKEPNGTITAHAKDTLEINASDYYYLLPSQAFALVHQDKETSQSVMDTATGKARHLHK